MHIVIAGGSGFVGKKLTQALLKDHHHVYILTRNTANKKSSPNLHYVQWLNDGDRPEESIAHMDAIINLAGTSLNSGRWTENRKKDIIGSRLKATKEIRRLISVSSAKPAVLLNASAIGYYGTSETETFTETDIRPPSDFLSETVHKWEAEAIEAQSAGIRTVLMRFGVILDKEQGALPQIGIPYKLYVGGPVGKGKQVLSWIHIDDIIQAAVFCLMNGHIQGPVNFTAPHPQTMSEFGKTLAVVLNRPYWMPAPSFLLKLGLGEKSILVLEGQRVLPERLLASGYSFLFPTLKEALENIMK
ncbi:TIGR01777 family oxidoreductase [Bacillus sp. 1P06AnD]|uniref:TIGR01777 family oxidoreductase n=1 Tax=Bacillus sp. 1P06AnD TaxID=3132208 RepID=UPI00399F8EFF